MFKIISKLMLVLVSAYHKEAQRLHSVAAETDQAITDAQAEAAAVLAKQLKLKDDLVQHKAAATAAVDRAQALESLLTK